MTDLLVNLLASVIAATAAWVTQRGLRYRAMAKRRAFFGVSRGERCLMVVARHASSPSEHSVASRDVAALVEVAAIVKECGGQADVATAYHRIAEFGRQTEFCVGGPTTNTRMAVHLRTLVPSVRFEYVADAERQMVWWVGPRPFRRTSERGAYVVVAKAFGPGSLRPVFLIAGQTSAANLAGARYLARELGPLTARYGTTGRFCLVLRVAEPTTYGPDYVELAADVTDTAFTPVEPAGGEAGPERESSGEAGPMEDQTRGSASR